MKFIDDVIAGRILLPMVPRVVQRVLAVLRQDNASLQQISAELEQDPVLSARVLRMANSSFFGGRRSVASISEGVHLIGFRSLETLVIACGAQAAFSDVPGVNLRQFWMTALLTAASSRQVAQRLRVDREAAYSAGLLQGVGHLILCMSHKEEALRHFTSMKSLWGTALAERERSAFGGVAHPEVSAMWVDKLGMPAPVVHAIEHSLDPLDQTHHVLARVVQLACSIATALNAGDSAEGAAKKMEEGLVQALKLGDYVTSADFATDFADLKTQPAAL